MQRSTEITYTCPCGTTFPATVYSTVNVTLEPQLLYRLLAGTLNTATCPNCGRASASAQPFFYHDMARGLFAYVHPRAELDDEERQELLVRLRGLYDQAVAESERVLPSRPQRQQGAAPRVRRLSPREELARMQPNVPPMQVIFGVDDLVALVESLLDADERLGRVALTTRSAKPEERARLRRIAAMAAASVQCFVEIEDTPDEFMAWIYGPRKRIEALGRLLKQRE